MLIWSLHLSYADLESVSPHQGQLMNVLSAPIGFSSWAHRYLLSAWPCIAALPFNLQNESLCCAGCYPICHRSRPEDPAKLSRWLNNITEKNSTCCSASGPQRSRDQGMSLALHPGDASMVLKSHRSQELLNEKMRLS